MTVLVGVRCTDGIVIGADSIATSSMGNHGLMQIPTEKISIVGDRIIVAGTGSVGLGQRFTDTITKLWGEKKFQNKCWEVLREVTAKTVKDFQDTGTPRTVQSGFGFGAMMAAPLEDEQQLIEFDVVAFQPELKTNKLNFVTMGSGQMLADPFLAFAGRVLWGDKVPDVKTGVFGVLWTLVHTIQYAPGGVGGDPRIAILHRVKGTWKAEILDQEKMEEQKQHISQIESRISEYPNGIFKEAVETAPPQMAHADKA